MTPKPYLPCRTLNNFKLGHYRLAKAAERQGHIIRPEQISRLGAILGRGQEHLVRFSSDLQRVVKITISGRGGYGLTPYVKYGTEIDLRPGTPNEYLERLALQNHLFGDDYAYESIVARGRNSYDLLTSQSVVRAAPGKERPTAAQIAHYMLEMGFEPVAGHEGKTYHRASDNVAVFDAHEGNFVLAPQTLVSIDSVIVHPDDRLLQVLERGLGSELF